MKDPLAPEDEAPKPEPHLPTDEVETTIRVLEALVKEPGAFTGLEEAQRDRLLEAAGRVAHPSYQARRKRKRQFRKMEREATRVHDQAVLAQAGMRRQRAISAFLPPAFKNQLADGSASPVTGGEAEAPRLKNPRACYVCKAPYEVVHDFYHAMCATCAELNMSKREQTASVAGRVALVTGGRIKIGYITVLKLLRAGARVIVTTRFPVDAARRFATEEDFEAWRDRLELVALDLRHLPSVELFAHQLASSLDRLDILIHNAAQTVRRPPEFYGHLIAAEQAPLEALPEAVRPLLAAGRALQRADVPEALATLPSPAELSVVPWPGEEQRPEKLFPIGEYDGDRQQIDLRTENSWRLNLADVPTPELVEVHLVNAIAPCLLTSRLKPLMVQDRTDQKHVINVSAMEASFSRRTKTTRHPHTNMAKAALNMMTRTSAADFRESGIFMNSVDTGWVTDEDPMRFVARKQRDHDFHPPLDSVDGAARVLDPLFGGLLSGQHPFGLFFKDYRVVSW